MERTVKRAIVSYVVYEQNTHRAAVVRCGNSAEALLTSGIPLRRGQTNTVSLTQEREQKDAHDL
jgi:hypothetical protein